MSQSTEVGAQPGRPPRTGIGASAPGPVGNNTIGLILNTAKAYDGYTLFAPKHYTKTYLMRNDGQIVNSWDSDYEPGQSVYLLENGNLLHCCFTKNKGFTRGGEGGRLEEYDWQGNLVWEFWYSSDKYLMHHDVEPLPNGNILALAVEKKSLRECTKAGFNPALLLRNEVYPDYVIEIEKTGPQSGKIVWEWHVWDHLIQDYDSSRENFGDVSAHPELIDCHGGKDRRIRAFWNHMNSIDYNPELDQIMLSVRGSNEIWIIDHSTTSKEASGHTGGKHGKGGGLLYRWGNPKAYRAGNSSDQTLFQQHDAQWVEPGYPGAGNILIFNNGLGRGYSSVDEIVPPIERNGNYILRPGKAFGPEEMTWTYRAESLKDFYSPEISGAHRLPNGNTLICAGTVGTFFEVTPAGEIVWKYVNPVVRNGILKQGQKPGKDHRGHDWNAVFKIHRYGLDYPGFTGRDLMPGGPLEKKR